MEDATEQAPNGHIGAVEQSTLLWCKTWDILSPPPSNTLSGTLVPKMLHKRHRRLSLEVHKIPIGVVQIDKRSPSGRVQALREDAKEGIDYYEECIVRILVEQKKKKHSNHDVADDMSVMDDEMSTSVADGMFRDHGPEITPDYNGWTAKYRLPLSTLTIKKVHRKTVDVLVSHEKMKQSRELIFNSPEDANDFQQQYQVQCNAEQRRSEAKIKAALGDTKVDNKEEITLLIEMVSAWDLPAADVVSSDPYVACFFRGQEVHRTKHIPKTLDPIWTVKTGSLFLLTVTTEELFSSAGLLLEVMDFDKIGANDVLGITNIPPKMLYEGKGERVEFKLMAPSSKAETTGSIAIRCRRATDYDLTFMKDFNVDVKKQNLGITKAMHKAHATQGGKGDLRSIVSLGNKKLEKKGANAGKHVYRVRPAPDPKRKKETEWLTKEQIQEEVMKDSHNWIETGSGSLARVFVEILGCDELPNLDAGGFLGNKTDAFISLVYEDTVVKTDIIDDSLNPRWLPWSKRAFVFHMMHPSSELFLGVFDFDPGIDDHDLIGRVSVDLCNLHKDTVYVLTYDIYPTAQMTTRKRKGSISIRLRMEVDDDRKLLLAALEPPPTVYVNVKTKKEWLTVRYTCQGKYDMDTYNMKVINSYVEELLAYQQLLYYVQDAVVALFLWRGHFPLTIGGRTFKLPLHSFNAFVLCVFLVEKPSYMPSLFFASIAWLLLAAMGWRRNVPDPWQKCKSYQELSEILISGQAQTVGGPDNIKPFQNADEAAEFEEWRRKRIMDAEEAARIKYEEQLKEQEEEMRELEELGGTDTDISTKSGGGITSSIDVFKPFLYPIQQYLGLAVGYVRILKNVIIWEECYIAFWVTTGCVILSVVFMFIPWVFALRWTARLIAWGVFGPWMKLVDVFYYSKIKPLTDEELEEKRKKEKLDRRKQRDEVLKEARINRENAKKLKAMKKVMFGRFITRVPVLKQDRHHDVPLPDSMAVPYSTKKHTLAELAMKEAGYHRTRLPGQRLEGDMIPRMENKSFTEAPVGQPTRHPSRLDQEGPGANPSKDSDVAAYAKLGAVIVGAGTVTLYGVPLITQAVSKLAGG